MNKLRNTFLVALFLAPTLAFAQVVPAPVQYVVYPEIPGPNANVSIEAQGVGDFLGNATITWTLNGKTVQTGTGDVDYNFTTGALGTQTLVGANIDSPTEGSFSQQWTFDPSLVNLIWEADTTAPPFYLGKPLYSAGSPIKVVAFPIVYNGSSRIAQSALTYDWSQDDNPVPNVSGLGRYTFSFTGNSLNSSENVSVDVYYGTQEVATGNITIPASAPQLLIYQLDPLRGLLTDTAFPSTVSLMGQEITLQAQPFYFSSVDQSQNSLAYDWQLDGQETSGPDSASGILTLRQTGEGVGQAQVSVSLQDSNNDNLIQNATAALNLLFGVSSSDSSASGL